MKAIVDLFSTDYGLMSAGVIAFMIGMGGLLRAPVHPQDGRIGAPSLRPLSGGPPAGGATIRP